MSPGSTRTQDRSPGPPWHPDSRKAQAASRSPTLPHSARRAPIAEGSQPAAGSRSPRAPRSSVSPDDFNSVSGATLDRFLSRVARSGEAALLDSGRAGRSSPYRFALMIFLKERDSCERTGLTGSAYPPPSPYTPQGISFCLRPTSKSVIGPCQLRDEKDFGCLLGRVAAAHLGGSSAAGGAREAGMPQAPTGAEAGARPKEGRRLDKARLGRKQPSGDRQKPPALGRWL